MRALARRARDDLPLVEDVGRNEAAPALHRIAEGGLLEGSVGARVGHAVADLRVLRPRRHEPPPKQVAAPHPIPLANGEDLRSGGDIESRHQRRELLNAEALEVEALGARESEAAAHVR